MNVDESNARHGASLYSRLALPMTIIALALGTAGCMSKTPCKASCNPFFDDVEQLDWSRTMRKASLSIAGRLPAPYEEQAVTRYGQAGLESVLDRMMIEEPFFDRLREIYNDLLLTDGYLDNASELLDQERYPNAGYFEGFDHENLQYLANKIGVDEAIAREPVNIIAHVVRNNRSFKEILTANYTLVNAYSAQAYGLKGVSFPGNPADRDNLVEVQLPNTPHAGLLSTVAFLNRFPTSDTNRNRHRARYVYKFFLDLDVLGFGKRPLSTTDIAGDNPTMNNPDCVACHTYVDPVAGLFQNWDDRGRYDPPEGGWHKDMFAPAFQAQKPGKQEPLVFLGQKLADSPGFARAAVHTVFTGLTGQEPIPNPREEKSKDPTQEKAFDAQQAVLAEISDRFVKSGYDLKVVFKNVILTPYFRAANLKAEVSADRAEELRTLGMGHLLTPEQLNRKIKAVLGSDRYWGRPGELAPREYLVSKDDYLIYFGGIDSYATTTRITEPNGIAANISRRMANELACHIVPIDFANVRDNRALVPYVEQGTVPENDQGAEDAGAANAIKTNIQYMHKRLLDERLGLDDPEIARTYQLFLETWREGKQAIAAGEAKAQLTGFCQASKDYWSGEAFKKGVTTDPQYTVRAWMAVTAYLMSDYRFLYE